MEELKDRLPPAILNSVRQKELFEAIDEYWESRVTPPLQRLRDLRSVFTASEEDLSLMLEELTAYFDYASDDLAKELSIFWKKNEINNKNNEWALEALLQRIKISTKEIKFDRLYCPKDTDTIPYGTVFYSKDKLDAMGVNLSDYFLSSHMFLSINYGEVISSNWDEVEIKTVIERYFEENVRPTHIVFEGLNFILYCESMITGMSMAIQNYKYIVARTV
ncbi:hypothetical protein KKI24_28910 [bacterium]|nr:hypothetical protein [bacterium]